METIMTKLNYIMKFVLTITFACFMFFNCNAQKTVYDKDNKKLSYQKEDLDLIFQDAKIEIPQKEGEEGEEGEEFALLTALIPTAIDLGFKIATNSLEKRQKKFSGEYTIQKSYLDAGKRNSNSKRTIPNIVFERKIQLKNSLENALKIVFQAESIKDFDGYIYYVKSIALDYSKAKTTEKSKLLDYTIEVKPIFFVAGEKKAQELYPITINSVAFGKNDYEELKYRTDIIPLPRDGVFSEVSIKVIETNPAKIKSEKILEMISTYKDDAKTIINNIIESKSSDDSGDDIDPNEVEGNP